MTGGLVGRVLIDSPLPQLDHLFDYSIPAGLEADAQPGVRVKVPLRSAGRVATGYLVEVRGRTGSNSDDADSAGSNSNSSNSAGSNSAGSNSNGSNSNSDDADSDSDGSAGSAGSIRSDTDFQGKLSPIEAVVSPAQVLTPEVWALARAVADRAAGNASDIIRLAVPPRQARVEKAWLASRAEAEAASGGLAGAAVPVPVPVPTPVPSTPFFVDYPAHSLSTVVSERLRVAVAAIPRLTRLRSGDNSDGTGEASGDGTGSSTGSSAGSSSGSNTGSTVGQWAVTLAELAVETLSTGRSAILAVPDYRDQDQVQAALDQLAPAGTVSRVDARQPNADRYRAFLTCLGDAPRIILGNRSAVYAPAARLGLIALWDDGDPLHAEPLSPYVHTRDAALVRQQQSECALVLLGHSRSVEAERLVELGWLADVHPTKLQHPRVIPTDFQGALVAEARAARIPSAAWNAAREALDSGPVLVQVASPGYAPVLACQTCKQSARCTHCQGPLGLASAGATPSCRWCGALAVAWRCSHCEGRQYRLVTVGTARTAEELGRAFPGVRVIVADGEHTIQQLGPEPALVIATRGAEPIPTGGYRAVLLLDGERMLARESLRVGEDCLRWWSNAAATAAPGASVILVGVGGALARALNSWQPEAYAAAELADRRTLRFPPAVRVASVTGTPEAVEAALSDLTAAHGNPADVTAQGLDVLGPVTTDPGLVRAIVRFPYGSGDEVAQALKAAIVRNATRRRKTAAGAFRPPPTLKVRFDDPELL
ncbi:MAG: Preprotein translocase subunit SecA [Microbacteriaceae bacterium]|nr:Preprotein translocase subunit SecA [Microbacteriaceae bacterium]